MCAKCFESEHKSDQSPRKPAKCEKCGEMTSVPILAAGHFVRIWCSKCINDYPYTAPDKIVPCVKCGMLLFATKDEDPVMCSPCRKQGEIECPICLEDFDPAEQVASVCTMCCKWRLCTPCALSTKGVHPCRKCLPDPNSKPKKKQPKSKVVWCTKCKDKGACTCPSQPDDYICIECKGPADTEGDECFHCQAPWCENCQDQASESEPMCPECSKPLPSLWCKCGGVLSDCSGCGVQRCTACSLDCLKCGHKEPKNHIWCRKCHQTLNTVLTDGFCPDCHPKKPNSKLCVECKLSPGEPWCFKCNLPWCKACKATAWLNQMTNYPVCPTCHPEKSVVVEGRTPLLRSIKRDAAEGKAGEKVVPIEDDNFLSSKQKKECGGCGCDAESAKCSQCESPLCGMCEAESGKCEHCQKACPESWCLGCDDGDDTRCHCGECSLVACCSWAKTDGADYMKKEKSARMRTMKPSDRKKLDERIRQVQDLVREMPIAAVNLQTEWGLEQVAKLAQRVIDACNKK